MLQGKACLKKVKSMPKGIELTYYSKDTKTKQPTNIYKINVNKMVRDKIKIIYIYIYIRCLY